MRIILCGLPMSGKTFYGKQIAKKLKLSFIDTDACLEKIHKRSCRDLFLSEGEDCFRQLEGEILLSLLNLPSCVISLGGGSLEREENGALVKELGRVIYLKEEIDVLLERLKSKPQIPAYLNRENPEKSFEELVKRRELAFYKYADLILPMGSLTLDEVCEYCLENKGLKNGFK